VGRGPLACASDHGEVWVTSPTTGTLSRR
jgi:hypothetical protein